MQIFYGTLVVVLLLHCPLSVVREREGCNPAPLLPHPCGVGILIHVTYWSGITTSYVYSIVQVMYLYCIFYLTLCVWFNLNESVVFQLCLNLYAFFCYDMLDLEKFCFFNIK